jgi:hypothetical protein
MKPRSRRERWSSESTTVAIGASVYSPIFKGLLPAALDAAHKKRRLNAAVALVD